MHYIASMLLPDPRLRALGVQIHQARRARGLSRNAAAKAAGLSARFFAQLETGEGNISIRRLMDVTDALNLELHSLFPPSNHASSAGIALWGLRGAGKTTLGRSLAEHLHLPFLELNDVIQEIAALDLSEIFALHSSEYFQRLTLSALQEIARRTEPVVLTLPGGLVLDESARILAQKKFTTVWIKATPQEHMNRVVSQGDQRPIQGREAPMRELESILAARSPLYRQANLTVDTQGRSIKESEMDLQNQLTRLGFLPPQRKT